MEGYIANISFDDLICENGESYEKVFERLSADFMWIKYDLDRSPTPSGIPNFPGIEAEPIDKDNEFLAYQCKFGNDAFDKNKGFYESVQTMLNSIKAQTYKVNKLCLFSKIDLPTGNKRDNIKDLIDDLKNNNEIIVDKYFGSEFLSELKCEKYSEILYKYFNYDSLKKDIYKKSFDEDINKKELGIDINNVKNGFNGKYKKEDVELAKYYQREYSARKLGYATIPFINDKFIEIEKDVANNCFKPMEIRTFDDLDGFLDRFDKEVNGQNSLIGRYKVEFESLIDNKRGLFINYGTTGRSCLEYKDNKIKFIDKR